MNANEFVFNVILFRRHWRRRCRRKKNEIACIFCQVIDFFFRSMAEIVVITGKNDIVLLLNRNEWEIRSHQQNRARASLSFFFFAFISVEQIISIRTFFFISKKRYISHSNWEMISHCNLPCRGKDKRWNAKFLNIGEKVGKEFPKLSNKTIEGKNSTKSCRGKFPFIWNSLAPVRALAVAGQKNSKINCLIKIVK